MPVRRKDGPTEQRHIWKQLGYVWFRGSILMGGTLLLSTGVQTVVKALGKYPSRTYQDIVMTTLVYPGLFFMGVACAATIYVLLMGRR